MEHLPLTGDYPLRGLVQDDAFYDGLDVGIRFAVRVLHAEGIETHQSCQGGAGHSYPVPTIDFHDGAPNGAYGFAALAALAAYGLPVAGLAYHWSVEHGLPHESFWRVEFAKPMADRADERPMFLWGYRHRP